MERICTPDEPPSYTAKLKNKTLLKKRKINTREGVLGQNPPRVKKKTITGKNSSLRKPVSRHTTKSNAQNPNRTQKEEAYDHASHELP
jgi:hypothetical protein